MNTSVEIISLILFSIPISTIATSNDSLIFNFLKNRHTVFHSNFPVVYNPTANAQGSQFLHISPAVFFVCIVCFDSHFTGYCGLDIKCRSPPLPPKKTHVLKA
jgi:hypothetical protein